jgi:hypothetical protein
MKENNATTYLPLLASGTNRIICSVMHAVLIFAADEPSQSPNFCTQEIKECIELCIRLIVLQPLFLYLDNLLQVINDNFFDMHVDKPHQHSTSTSET